MRFIRFKRSGTEEITYGCVIGDNVKPLKGNLFGSYKIENNTMKLRDVRLLNPCVPGKIVALAANYGGATGVTEDMKEPVVFMKPSGSIQGPEETIVSPFKDAKVWGEAELGIVVGRKLKNAPSASEAKKAIFGYLCANDVTAENVEGRDHHLARSKGADTFCPIGPWIDPDFEPSDAIIEAYQNGVLLRRGNLSDRIWKDVKVIEWLSHWMTLNEGDIILTGTPPRVRERTYLSNGDIFEVRIERLGSLKNRFVSTDKI